MYTEIVRVFVRFLLNYNFYNIVSVIERTNTTAEDLKHVVTVNEDNVQAINRIVEKFK